MLVVDDLQIVADQSDAFDSPQSFLSHLLFEKRVSCAAKHDFALIGSHFYSATIEVGIVDNRVGNFLMKRQS